MKMHRFLPALAVLALSASVFASTAESARGMIDNALKAAKPEGKGVIVIFHASWCGWCKELDKSLENPKLKAVMDKDFVILHVTVLEDDKHKADENPGGAELLAKMHGENQGIPYYFVLDSTGKTVADSRVDGKDGKLANMGFPTEPNELAHFMDMLKAGNPNISAQDAADVSEVMTARAAEIKAKH